MRVNGMARNTRDGLALEMIGDVSRETWRGQ